MNISIRCTASLIITVLALSGCTTTEKTRGVEAVGFLSDYSQLRTGTGDEPQRMYVSPSADWASYTKVLIDPVRIYAPRDSKLAGLPATDQQALVNYLDVAIREALKSEYILVRDTGPDVMRLRIALTEAAGSVVVLDTMSNVMPPVLAVNALKRLATGTHLAVGNARIEAELQDSASGSQLAAMVDERSGGKTFKGKFGKWNDTKAALDGWASSLQKRLAGLSSK